MYTTESTAVGQGQQQTPRLLPISSTIICKWKRRLWYKLQPQRIDLPRMPRQSTGGPPSVYTAGALFQKMCYENKDALSAGIIVAGWDKESGPSVYNIPLGGGLFRQPWAIGGMCSGFVDHRLVLTVSCRFWVHLRLWLL